MAQNAPISSWTKTRPTRWPLATATLYVHHRFHQRAAASLPLRITLAWTDPPGDPAAAIKLVNSLNLIVTNGDTSIGPVFYYGNDIGSGSSSTRRKFTNSPTLFDGINNVQNVFISPPLARPIPSPSSGTT